MDWRLAPALAQLLWQVNALSPNRLKDSDGTIGDEAHQQRKSDHNPDDRGVVCGLDVTNDPAHGVVSRRLAEALIAVKDPRLAYVISNRQIANPDIEGGKWRPYGGANPHDHHCHVSVRHQPVYADSKAGWDITRFAAGITPDHQVAPAVVPPRPTLRPGSKGDAVKTLQRLLGFKGDDVDGVYGHDKQTEKAVRAFQQKNGLVVDGVVGPYTWRALDKVKP